MYKHIFVSDRKIQKGILSDFEQKTTKNLTGFKNLSGLELKMEKIRYY
jgi:hypothetical protein